MTNCSSSSTTAFDHSLIERHTAFPTRFRVVPHQNSPSHSYAGRNRHLRSAPKHRRVPSAGIAQIAGCGSIFGAVGERPKGSAGECRASDAPKDVKGSFSISFGGSSAGVAARQGWASLGRLLIGQLAPVDEIVEGGGGGSTDRSKDRPGGCQPISGSDPAARSRGVRGEGLEAGQVVVDLPGDVALENPDDLFLGFAFLGPAFDVGPGARVGAHPGGDDVPQR
jgi:hypothetical protein